jgi:2'-5' RNA ligase
VLRTFISIPLPGDIREAVKGFMERIGPLFPGARWENPGKLHLTLKFLGDTDERLVGDVLGVMRGACADASPFTLTVSGFGAFPSPSRPRVLWIGCADPGGTLPGIQSAIDAGLPALGFPAEERAFHPHVTIARFRGVGAATHLTSLAKSVTFDPRHTLVDAIFLMRSVLQPAGSAYSVLGSVALGMPGGGGRSAAGPGRTG